MPHLRDATRFSLPATEGPTPSSSSSEEDSWGKDNNDPETSKHIIQIPHESEKNHIFYPAKKFRLGLGRRVPSRTARNVTVEEFQVLYELLVPAIRTTICKSTKQYKSKERY